MARWLRWLRIVAAVALAAGLSGCALLSKDDSAKLHAQAQADLSRWADATTVVPPTWNPSDPPVGISIEWATGTADGKKLTVGFTGAPGPASQGCGADYTAEAVESQTAVVVIVTKHPHSAFGETCSAVGAVRTAEVELAAPLGNRAVLEVREGRPVAVTPTH